MSKLKFTVLSGTTSVTENLYIYEYENEMMIVDCGVGFPDIEMHGVDLVIPDFTYIKKNQEKLKGIIVSQGHEDHQGALPFLLNEISSTVYAPKLVSTFIKHKFEDYGVKGSKIETYDPDKDTLNIGPFKIHPFRVSHSIPDTVGFAIDTPEGRVFHVAEHKFDPNPVVGYPFDVQKAASLASKGVLFLASDCLGSNRKGSTPPERPIEGRMEDVMKKAEKSIYFTTISSNLSRIQQVINIAERLNRKVAFVGYSIRTKSEAAFEHGILKAKGGTVVHIKKALKMAPKDRMFIIAGCYGQVGSSLFRAATDDHHQVSIDEGDMVVFSADPSPPYTKESENFVIDNLIEMGADVHYYDLDEGLYVSGHGSQDDIVRLFDIVKPRYFIPIGGTIRFMHSYKKLAKEFGADPKDVFELKPGESLEFENGNVKKGDTITVRDVYVDGHGIGDVGRVMLKDRKTLAESGVAVVIVELAGGKNKLAKDPEVISRGFVFQKQEKDFLRKSGKDLRQKLESLKKLDRKTAKYKSVDYLSDYFYSKTGRRPMILPVVVEV